MAYNAGIFGGTDITFFKEYTHKAFEFVDKNNTNLSEINVANFNIFFEQYLFYCLAKKKSQSVNVLIPEIIGDNEYKGFGDFARVPYEKQYLHLLGSYKKSEFVCQQLANRLRQDYPIYYYRIIELFKKKKLALFKDYYFFTYTNSQDDLVSRGIELKLMYSTNEIVKINPAFKLQSKENVNVYNFFEKPLIKSLDRKQIQDITNFCQRINGIYKNKFSLFSLDYLYARDLNMNQYFQYLFENLEGIYQKIIIADDCIEIIESEYDWSSFFGKKLDKKFKATSISDRKEEKIYTVIIPECDSRGFTIGKLDNLDLIILEILEKAKTIRALLDELKEYFDEEELCQSQITFEKLVFGRIKMGIHLKSIKVLF